MAFHERESRRGYQPPNPPSSNSLLRLPCPCKSAEILWKCSQVLPPGSGWAVRSSTSNKPPGDVTPLVRGWGWEQPGAHSHGNTTGTEPQAFPFPLAHGALISPNSNVLSPERGMLEPSRPWGSARHAGIGGQWGVRRWPPDFLWWKSCFPAFLSSCFGLCHVRLGCRRLREPSWKHSVATMSAKGHQQRPREQREKSQDRRWSSDRPQPRGRLQARGRLQPVAVNKVLLEQSRTHVLTDCLRLFLSYRGNNE